MNKVKIIQPTDTYEHFKLKIPESLKSKQLVVLHCKSEDFICNRWTTRTRDLRSKHAKRIEYDICVGYLIDEAYINRLFDPEIPSFTVILAHRLYGDTWVETVDTLNLDEISFIEYYET